MDTIDDNFARPKAAFSSPTVGATTTCDLSLARRFVFTVSQATTLAFTNVPSSSFWVEIELLITNGAAFALTYPASVVWLQGLAATLKASGVDRIRGLTKDGGTTWYFHHVGRNLPRVLFQTRATTTSASEVSLTSFSLPANSLGVNGQQIRVRVHGVETTGAAGQIRVKFGATYVLNVGATNNVASNTSYLAEAMITRQAATTQESTGVVTAGLAVTTNDYNVPTETLSGAVTIDIRGLAGAGSTLIADVGIEYLAS